MPSVFDRQFAAIGFPGLLTQFGEPVVYLLAGGGTRSFDAIIERSPPAIYDAAGNVVMPKYTIRFSGSCKGGVQAKEVNTGGDRVSFIAEVGDAVPTKCTVMQIMSQDSGVIQLALM